MAPTASKRVRTLSPLPLLDEQIVLQRCEELGILEKHAYTMWRHILHHNVTNVRDIPGLPKALYAMVEQEFALTTSRVVKEERSADQSTTKLLIELQDGAQIETVIMRYGRFELRNFPEDMKQRKDGKVQFSSKERATVCVSSQVGCQMGCTFCATGTMNLLSNLTAGEILEQLYHANQVEKIRNVVFMGMGEPLDNYEAVISAIHAMTDVRRFSLSPSRISVSTVGVIGKLRRLADDAPGVSLALSLHAPTQEKRLQIVPSGKAWHIDRIIEAMDYYIDRRVEEGQKRAYVLIEYVLIANVNDSEETAHELGKLLEGKSVIVNVIPYNPTDVPYDYKPPSREVTDRFNEIVRSYDVRTIIRQELGQDIASACGQLVVDSAKQAASGGKQAACGSGNGGDIEDMMGGNASSLRQRRSKGSPKASKVHKAKAPAEPSVADIQASSSDSKPQTAVASSSWPISAITETLDQINPRIRRVLFFLLVILVFRLGVRLQNLFRSS